MRYGQALVSAVLATTLTLSLAGRGEAVINVGNTIQTGMISLNAGRTARVYIHHRAGQGARCAVRIEFRNEAGDLVQGFAQLNLQGGDAGSSDRTAVAFERVRAEVTLVPIPQANGNCIVSAEVLNANQQTLSTLGDAAAFDIVTP